MEKLYSFLYGSQGVAVHEGASSIEPGQPTAVSGTDQGWQVLATVVEVPEIAGTFMEVETLVEEDGLSGALASLAALLSTLGEHDRTDEKYTDAVSAARR